jgi:hypothetical protein
LRLPLGFLVTAASDFLSFATYTHTHTHTHTHTILMAGGVTEVAEHLPSKLKALSSNSSAAKRKKKALTICLVIYILVILVPD